jgi:hypothetical protein
VEQSNHSTNSTLGCNLTSEEARDVRVRAWRFVFDCYAKKKAATSEEKAGVFTGRRAGEEGDQ